MTTKKKFATTAEGQTTAEGRSCFLCRVESYYDILVMRTGEKEHTPWLGAIKVRTRVSLEDLQVG